MPQHTQMPAEGRAGRSLFRRPARPRAHERALKCQIRAVAPDPGRDTSTASGTRARQPGAIWKGPRRAALAAL
eukprot:6302080-Alexandrium_andersonii.AAC.1